MTNYLNFTMFQINFMNQFPFSTVYFTIKRNFYDFINLIPGMYINLNCSNYNVGWFCFVFFSCNSIITLFFLHTIEYYNIHLLCIKLRTEYSAPLIKYFIIRIYIISRLRIQIHLIMIIISNVSHYRVSSSPCNQTQ